MTNKEASPRYQYGELRLGHLNIWAKFLLRRFTFQKVQTHDGYGMYFARFYGPTIFFFGFFSVILSAMQVGLAVHLPQSQDAWTIFEEICRWFSIFSIMCAVVLLAAVIAVFAFLVARETIYALRQVLQSLLELHRINAVIISITPGEQSKSISMYLNLLNQAIDAGTDRSSTVISLGGGVVKDLPGIVAATLYRGVDLIHIPTTLLAQLDGTIDFNQAVNMPQGKNLVGTYYVASVVWINTIFLQTLDDRRVRDGLSAQGHPMLAA
ncbi:MAG: hypothetical protein L6R37_003145 [Teloschistes peruensis]|nr:MAG: hypothetical protein L6R37_003145 [Teloschistes peruensis]